MTLSKGTMRLSLPTSALRLLRIASSGFGIKSVMMAAFDLRYS
jgi:hypothetical protein